jgi:hypothetical protein
MTQSLLTSRHQADNDVIDYTPGSAVTGGAVVNPGGGLIGYADRDIAANEKASLSLVGLRRYKKSGSTGPTFAVGDTIVWDDSAGLAINLALTGIVTADKEVAICVEAATASQDFVLGMPLQVLDRYNVIRPRVVEFDCEADTINTPVTLIPAWMNKHGLVFRAAFGLVTEVFAGATEDQGIITVEDGDGTDICTLTPSNGGADAAGDIVQSDISVWSSATGVAWKTVAAGKSVQAMITQKTSGAGAAGKIKVYVDFVPLL